MAKVSLTKMFTKGGQLPPGSQGNIHKSWRKASEAAADGHAVVFSCCGPTAPAAKENPLGPPQNRAMQTAGGAAFPHLRDYTRLLWRLWCSSCMCLRLAFAISITSKRTQLRDATLEHTHTHTHKHTQTRFRRHRLRRSTSTTHTYASHDVGKDIAWCHL